MDKKNLIKALIYEKAVAKVWPTALAGNKIKEEIKKNWRMTFILGVFPIPLSSFV